MAENSGIEWTHHTFNPWRGCTKISAGCAHCYAETLSRRNPRVLGVWGPRGTRAIATEAYWQLPLTWDAEAKAAGERRRVFCASLADVFEGRDTMPREWLDAVEQARARLFRTIDSTPHLDWLLLTKRPQNIGRMWHSRSWIEPSGRTWGRSEPTAVRFRRDNVWLGSSVEDQAAVGRIDELLEWRDLAALLFLSIEPLLEPVQLPVVHDSGEDMDEQERFEWGLPATRIGGKGAAIDWAIIGQESRGKAAGRTCDLACVRSLVRQCRVSSTAVYVKQIHIAGRVSGEPAEWPEDLRVREFPRRAEVAHA